MKQTNRKLTLEYVVLCYCHVLGAVIYHALVCAVFLLRPGCPTPQPSFSKIIVARIRPPLYQVISRSACTNICDVLLSSWIGCRHRYVLVAILRNTSRFRRGSRKVSKLTDKYNKKIEFQEQAAFRLRDGREVEIDASIDHPQYNIMFKVQQPTDSWHCERVISIPSVLFTPFQMNKLYQTNQKLWIQPHSATGHRSRSETYPQVSNIEFDETERRFARINGSLEDQA